MAQYNRRTVGMLLGMGLASALGVGCATSSESAEAGALELVIEPSQAPYDVVGRFRLTGLEAGTLDRDVVFDGVRSRESVSLPPGRYSLTLHPGASVLCADEGRDILAAFEDGVSPTATRLVSAAPRLVTIAPGETLTARIRLDAEPQPSATSARGAQTPCAPAATTVLSRR